MAHQVHKVSGSYQQVYDALLRCGLTMLGPLNNGDSAEKVGLEAFTTIRKDIDRSPFIGNRDHTKRFIDLWLNHHQGLYFQGDPCGASIAVTAFIGALHDHTFEMTHVGEQEMRHSSDKDFLSFINDKNEAAGMACVVNSYDRELWIIAVISKANRSLSQRQVSLYFSDKIHEKINVRPFQYVDLKKDLREQLQSTSLANNIVDSITVDGQAISWQANDQVKPKCIDKQVIKKLAWQLQCKKDTLSLNQYLEQISGYIFKLKAQSKKSQIKKLELFVDDFQKRVKRYYNSDVIPSLKQYQAFKTTCVGLIAKVRASINASQALEKVLVNLLLFVLTLGIFYLIAGAIKYAVKGRFLLYDPKPIESQTILESMQRDVARINTLV